MRVAASDYESLKGFFAWMWEHVLPRPESLRADQQPLAMLEGLECKSAAQARLGLGMAIGDIVEMCAEVAGDRLCRIDIALAAEDLPTLSAVRARFSHKAKAIVKRGCVRNEAEYYALRNLVDRMPEAEQMHAWALLAQFEEQAVAKAR